MADAPDDDAAFYLPPELEGGVYAHTFSMWHTPFDFTIDFAVIVPELADADDPELPPAAPAKVVARIRIPPTLAFDLIRMINGEMADYEAEWGEIIPPQKRQEEEQ
jgi:hypothetical protein